MSERQGGVPTDRYLVVAHDVQEETRHVSGVPLSIKMRDEDFAKEALAEFLKTHPDAYLMEVTTYY